MFAQGSIFICCDFSDVENFTFGIKEVTNGQESPEYTVTNNGSEIKFESSKLDILRYSIDTANAFSRSDVGEHKYEIREIPGNVANITYDNKKYTVTVTVTDDGKGHLNAEVTNVTYPLNNGEGNALYENI